MPNHTKPITSFPLITLKSALIPPVCVVCLQKIKRGERYYSRRGLEEHVACATITAYVLENNHTERGSSGNRGGK